MANNPATYAWRNRQDRRRAEREGLAKLGAAASAGVAEGTATGLARARTVTNVTRRAEAAEAYKSRLSQRLQESLSQAQSVNAAREEQGGGGGVWGAVKDVAGDVAGAVGDASSVAGKAAWITAKKAAMPALDVLDAGRKFGGAPTVGNQIRQVKSGPAGILAATNPANALAATARPNENRAGYRAYEEQKAKLPPALQVAADIAVDPLTWAGPGLVKGAATRVLPAAARNSRAVRAASALIEQPARVGVGQVVGGAAGAQVGDTYDLPDEVTMLLTLAGAIGGGGVAGATSARQIPQRIKGVDAALARAQGRAGKPAAIGLQIEDTHPHLQRYVDALDDAEIPWEWDQAGSGTIKVLDEDKAWRLADDALNRYVGRAQNERGSWEGGGAGHYGGDGVWYDHMGVAHEGAPPGGASQKSKIAHQTAGDQAEVDWAERVIDVMEDGVVDPSREAMRTPWEPGATVRGFEPVADEVLDAYRAAWKAKKTAANAEQLGAANADRFLASKVTPEYSKAATIRELYIEIDRAETFDTKLTKVGDYGGERAPKNRQIAAYIARLKKAAAEIELGGERATEFDTPEIVRARAEQSALPETVAIEEAAPVQYGGRTMTRGEMRAVLANEFYGQGAPVKGRRMDVVIGLPASGKSKVLVNPLRDTHGAMVVDSDFVKEAIPEFQGGRGAGAVHQESSDIADAVVARAIGEGDNLVLPLVGKNPDRIDAVRMMAEARGYEVHLHFMELDPREAAKRGITRWQQEGRFVDPAYIVNRVGENPRLTYDTLKGRFASYEAYSNDVPFGDPPRFLESSDAGPGRRSGGRPGTDAGAPGGGGAGARGSDSGALPPGAADAAAGGRPGGAGAGGVADAGVSPVEAAGRGGADAPGKPAGKPELRFLGKRGAGRIATFEHDWGDVRVGDVIDTPYGKVEITGKATPGGVGIGKAGGEQIVGRFLRSNSRSGVSKMDTVLLRRQEPVAGTGRLAAVGDDGGPLAGMRPEMGADGRVARWTFKGGSVERAEDGTWFLDWEGQRYVGDSPEEVAAQVERGPADLGEMQDQVEIEDEMPLDRSERPERPERGYGDDLREKFLRSLEYPADPERAMPPADEWDEFLNSVAADDAGGQPPNQPPAPSGSPEFRDDWQRVGQAEEATDAERMTAELYRQGINAADLPVNLPEIQPGLTRMDRFGNKLKELTGIGVAEDPLATPAMRARKRMQPVVDSQAARFSTLWDVRAKQAFRRDETGRIVDLMGAPTIQDLAAKLPHYQGALTPEQLRFMEELRGEAEKYGDLIREAGIVLQEYRPDVVEGGFYLPRGRAETEWLANLPETVPSGVVMGTGTKKGFEKGATFESMVEGIEAGFTYSDFGDALRYYARDAGRRALDQYASEYFKSLRYATGQSVGMSYADRIDEGLRVQYQGRVRQLAQLRGRLQTAEKRAGIAVAEADELDHAVAAFAEATQGLPDDLRGLNREAVAQRRRTQQLRTPKRVVEVDEATGEVRELAEQFGRADTIERVVAAFEDQLPDSLDYANAVELAIGRTLRRLSELESRGFRWSTEAKAIGAQVERVKREIDKLQPEYRAAVSQARKGGRDQRQIGFAPLNGRSFPIEMANAANKWLQAEKPPMGRHAGLTTTAEALNRLMRGVNATMDVSFLGIQGLLAGARDPKAYGAAMKVAYKAMADPQALGSYISEFDGVRAAQGMPTSRDWARLNLHIGGADTEFAIHAGEAKGLRAAGRTIAKAPVGKQATALARGSNRMFGYFGDAMRLEIADTMAAAAKASGRELDDVAMREIANAANHMTGWSPNAFGGSVGQLAMFAPRFFQSQLETVALAFGRGGIDNAEARKALLRLTAGATAMTVLANEVSPDGMKPEQYLSPFRDPKNPASGWNPNFMRFRIDGNDYSLLGPWDSLLKAGAAAVYGEASAGKSLLLGEFDEARKSALSGPGYLARTKASPLLGLGWDLLSGETFMGEDAWAAETMVKRFMPLSAQDLVGSGELFTPSGAVRQAVSMGGVKATPQSPSEQLDSLALAQYGVPWRELQPVDRNKLKVEHPDVWQRSVERKDSNMQRVYALQEQTKAEQASDDELLLAGQLTVDEWAAGANNRRTELRGATEELTRDFTGSGAGNKVLQGYYEAIDAAEVNGRIEWDQVDAYVEGLSDADRAIIERNAGASLTPVAKLKSDLVRQYYSIPVYNGYTSDEARAIDDLYARVNAKVPGTSRARKMEELKKLAGGVDEEVKKGVVRRIYGLLRETGDRRKWKARNPAGAAFLGNGPLTPEAVTAVQGMIASREAAA